MKYLKLLALIIFPIFFSQTVFAHEYLGQLGFNPVATDIFYVTCKSTQPLTRFTYQIARTSGTGYVSIQPYVAADAAAVTPVPAASTSSSGTFSPMKTINMNGSLTGKSFFFKVYKSSMNPSALTYRVRAYCINTQGEVNPDELSSVNTYLQNDNSSLSQKIFTGSLGTATSATDKWYFNCPSTVTTKLWFSVIRSAGTGCVRAIYDGSGANTTSCGTHSGQVVSAGTGNKYFTINKNPPSSGALNYVVLASCLAPLSGGGYWMVTGAQTYTQNQ